MTDRITRNRKGVLHVNGTPVRVPKSADYTDTEALQYVEKCAEWAPRCPVGLLDAGDRSTESDS